MIGPVTYSLKPGAAAITILSNFGTSTPKIAISCTASEGSASINWENAEGQSGHVIDVGNAATKVFTVNSSWLYIKASASVNRAPTIRIKVSYE